ncbi:MAG: TetR/AcrR family transcriptional regulator [Rhodomicrobium sp.]
MARLVAERADIVPLLGEIFRTYGYEGASLSIIGEATGLGKGSLYHFFPGGKEEMAAAVLADIEAWFENRVFGPLRECSDPKKAVAEMFAAVDAYFQSGGRVCLVGAFALSNVRDRFSAEVQRYFSLWTGALAAALEMLMHEPSSARDLAEEAVSGIQGALVLARAAGEPAIFTRTLQRLEMRLLAAGLPT